MPGRLRVQRERQPQPGQALAQDGVGRRVGRMHQALGVDHQHAFAQRLDHQIVDLRLHLRAAAAALRHRGLARQPAGEFVGQQRHHEEAGAGERRLHEAGRGIARLL
jgi:hypothetical protein